MGGRRSRARPLIAGVHRRLAKDDATVHRHDVELKRQALAVAVRPCGSDFRPKAFVALVGDVPCVEVRLLGFGG